MVLKDLSALPKDQGLLPDSEPWLAPRLAEAWQKTVDTGDKAMASEDARIRHSWAGMCARRISYEVAHEAPTEPLTVADYWRFGTGTVIHERWQAVIQDAFPEAEVEKKVTIPEIPSAGHIDLFIAGVDDNPSVAVELKTINGFGFKQSIGARGVAEGPRTSAVLQGALNAWGARADLLKIVYLSLENLSPRELKKIGTQEYQRFAAEWTFDSSEWMPKATAEITRLRKIVELADAGTLAPRAIPDDEIPKGARVTNPKDGSWMLADGSGGLVQAGSTWHCAYCPFQSKCAKDGAS